ncbi:MAG: SDR family NAD(P)-dependent oxidoreductase [Pseudomonadota bacterium]
MTTSNANWAVITGSTGGIGSEIAELLAARGQNMILLNRSVSKTDAQKARLLAKHPGLQIEAVIADLMDASQTARAIKAINAIPGRVDALYNNSGVLTSEKVLSKQNFESQFAVNVLAPYQLTIGLKDKMMRNATDTPGMVVLFSSSAVNPQKSLKLSDLPNPERVGGLMGTYAQSKLAVTTLAPALAGTLRSDNILIRAVDPGATKTAMTSGNSAMPKALQWLAPLLFSPADKQAAKVVNSADPAAFDGQTGIFVANGKRKRMPKPAADTPTQAELLSLLERALIVLE